MKVLVTSLANALTPAIVLTEDGRNLTWVEGTGDEVFQHWP